MDNAAVWRGVFQSREFRSGVGAQFEGHTERDDAKPKVAISMDMTARIATMVLFLWTIFFRQADRGLCGGVVNRVGGSVVNGMAMMMFPDVVCDRVMNSSKMLARFRKPRCEDAAHERNHHQRDENFANDPDHGAIKRWFAHRVKPAVGS